VTARSALVDDAIHSPVNLPRVAQALEHITAVPFVELGGRFHRPFKERLVSAFEELLEQGAFINGPAVREFELAFSSFIGTAFCVGTSSGIDALRLGIVALGLERGDEVIVPANTFVATFAAVVQAGGVPVPVDVSEADYNIDVDAIEDAVTPRTRFLVPVHMYGQMADMRRIAEIAKHHDLIVFEDACQAHGAERDGLRAGTTGAAAAFSFYPSKNLGAAGDAGALVTDDERVAQATRSLREHGQVHKNEYAVPGYTARLDTIQAIVLLEKLSHVDRWNEERAAAASYFDERLRDLPHVATPPVPDRSNPAWHLYVVRVPDADALGAFLGERGIQTGRHYPVPAHLSPAYSFLGYQPGSFPLTERLSCELLSLPLFPGIETRQMDLVVDAVSAFLERG
jgi:dTDP-4-amino-4,6-dideoxygalactose transaminase